MEFLPLHIVEWFVVPLAMYLQLFWWRDNPNILLMPLADLVALFVIADVAVALHFSTVFGAGHVVGAGSLFSFLSRRTAVDLSVER